MFDLTKRVGIGMVVLLTMHDWRFLTENLQTGSIRNLLSLQVNRLCNSSAYMLS